MDEITQVISDSIADLDGAENVDTTDSADTVETGDSDTGQHSASGDDNSTGEPQNEPTTPAEQDALAAELGIKPGKNNRIPYHRVQAIVKKAQERHAAELAEREARLQKVSEYETPEFQHYLRQSQTALQLLDENPQLFLRKLAENDPRYAQLLTQAQQQAAQNAQVQEVEPDMLNADGSLGYSLQAMQRLMEAKAAEVERRIEEKFNQQFGPIANEYRQAQLMRGAKTKAQNQLQIASSWIGFNDHKADILQAMQSDRHLSLEQAYIKVVGPKLAGNRDEMRKQLLAEINANKTRGAQGSVGPRPGVPAASDTPRDTETIIREAIAGLNK